MRYKIVLQKSYDRILMQVLPRVITIGLVVLACSTAVGESQTGPVSSGGPAARTSLYVPVKINGRILFEVTDTGPLSAAQRAEKITRRLDSLIARQDPLAPFTPENVLRHPEDSLITLGGQPIMNVTDADAQEVLMTRAELALLWGNKLAQAVRDARAARTNPLAGAGILIRNSFSDLLVSVFEWLPRLAGAIVLWVIFWVLTRGVRRITQVVTAHTDLDSNMRQLIRALTYYGTWFMGGIVILSALGLDGGGIATGLGISGFVLGFAFKDILSHFFAGLILLFGGQFHLGDQIVVNNYEGTVERIELRALYMRTYDNRLVIIPNGDVFTSIVTSNTASPVRRREFVIGIGYDADIEQAQRLALDTIHQVDGVAEAPAPDVLVDALMPSTINLRLRFYTNSQRADYLKVGSECMKRVKEAFTQAHISIPTDIYTVIVQNPEVVQSHPSIFTHSDQGVPKTLPEG